MDDNIAIELLTKTRLYIPIISQNIELKNYLDNRYSDIPSSMFTYREVKYRLINHIEKRPTCRVCGGPVKFIGDVEGKSINGYRMTCSHKCHGLDTLSFDKMILSKLNRTDLQKENEKVKRELTCIEKYGCKSIFIAKKDQIKQTMYEKYGGYTLSSPTLRKKLEETSEKLYGNKNIRCTEYGKQKIKETQYKKYNGRLYNQTDEGRNRCSLNAKLSTKKRYETNKIRYGHEYIMDVPKFAEKRREKMKNNHSYKTSMAENFLYNILLEIFQENDIERFHHDDVYPFDCDFYIHSINLYIEYNGSQYHHGYAYTGECIDDIYLYIYLKKGYLMNIDTWAKRDVKKMKIAKENNLNFIVIFGDWHHDWQTYIKNNKYRHLYKNNLVEALKNICHSNNGFSIIGELNKYKALYKYLTWENSGVVRGSLIDEKAYNKLSDAAKEKIYTFEFNGETKYVEPKDTARGIVVKHLGRAVPIAEFFTDEVFTQEFLEYLNDNVIHPMFDLPDQSSYDDVKEIEDLIEVGSTGVDNE